MKVLSKLAASALGLLLLASLFLSPSAKANTPVSVDYNTVTGQLDPLFLGVNYVGFWDSVQGSPGSQNALRRAGVKLIRFPGGTPGSWYIWDNPYVGGSSSTSPLQLWQFAQGVGAKVMFQTNATSNTLNGATNDPSGAHEAAWVTYAKNNNIDAPLWEVDNEPDNGMPSDYDWSYLNWYFTAFNNQAPAMKAANPAIKVLGPAGTNTWYWWGEHSLDMFRQQCDANADAISLHVYDGPNYPGYANVEGVAEVWQSRMNYIRSVYPTKPLYITEWNTAGQPGAASRWAGLMVANADVLGAFAKSGVTAECYFGAVHVVNNNWGILGGSGDVIPQDSPAPWYFILPLWSKMGDRILNATSTADPSASLSVWSHKKSDGTVQVMLINKTTAQTVDLTFTGYNPAGKTISIYEAKASAGGAADTDIYYNNVLTPNTSTTDLPGPLSDSTGTSTYTRTLPAYSVTVLDFASPGNPTQAPTVPTGLTASANSGFVQLSWTGSANSPANYIVQRATASGGPYTTIASPVPSNYLDTGVSNGTTYWYHVAATNSIGTSAYCAPVSATPALQPPTGVTAVSLITQAALSWTSAYAATSYNVKRSTTSGSGYANVATGVTGNSYTNSGLTNGTTYYYVMSSVNASMESAISPQVSATPSTSLSINAGGGAVSPFIGDTDVTATSGGQASNWQGAVDTSAVTNPAPLGVYQSERYGNFTYTIPGPANGTSYTVRLHFTEDADNGSGQRIENVSINGTQVLTNYDIFAATGVLHKANIQQFTTTANASGITIAFTPATGSPDQNAKVDGIEVFPAGGGAPPVPTGLVATAGNAQVALTWNASGGATAYDVKRSTVSGSGYATVSSPTVTNYTNTGLTNGTTYYFVVDAKNASGTSANSAQASATPVAAPAAPTGLTATAGNSQVALSWTASGGATSYNVLRSTVNGSGYAQVTNVATTSYTNTGLTNGTTYYFVVNAVNAGGTSANSAQASATPQAAIPPVPTGLAATPGNAQVALTWNASAGATAYDVKRSTVSGSGYVTVSSPTTTSYTNTGLTNGTTYYFVVDAKNASGTSANSAQVSATPTAGGSGTVISINFQGGNATAMGAAESAGVIAKTNWNNSAGSSGTLAALKDSTGTATTASVNWTCSNTWQIGITDTAGNNRMMNGYQDIQSTTTVSAIPSSFTTSGYDVYVYADGDRTSEWGSYTIGGTTILANDNANFSGTFTQANNSAGNYLIFTNVNAASFTLTAAPDASHGGQRAPVNAIQIVAHSGGGAPAAPTGLAATPGNAQVALTWTASTGATSYNVLRSTVNGSGYASVATGIAVTNYTNTGLTNGTTYYFVVTATNATGTSGNSNQASATPQPGIPPAPTGLIATPGNAQVALTWNASAGATAYDVKRSTVSGSGYATVSSPTVTNYTNTGLTNGTTYYFVVDAKNAGGTSANSAQVSATPSAGGAGSLTATSNGNAGPFNLTTEGPHDWIKWGSTSSHKATGGSQISNRTAMGAGTINGGSGPQLSWTDGTPITSATNDTSADQQNGTDAGFWFTAPADTTQRVLVVHLAGWNTGGKLVAHLSDGSAADFVDTSFSSPNNYNVNYTLTYKAGSAGQTLKITWTWNSGNTGGNVNVCGAAF